MRTLLLRAAATLVEQGKAPSVTEVADAAEVSRRTAYRYFPTQEQLLTEVSLERLRPQVQAALSRLAEGRSPAETLDAAIAAIQGLAVENEALLRTIVRLSLDRRLGEQQNKRRKRAPVRGSRRVDWIEAALAPARPLLAPSRYERLVSGITLCLGMESLIALQDVRALTPAQSIEICRWAGRAMLDAALREQRNSKTRAADGRRRKRRRL
ncbi:MAG TPA: helix-turn-helix domain-containing protein [Bryobacteraceae bacterium]|nr:helix-turn-helix domain-containing protein [Bryobacteraceae bacterium]